ncbi:MAG: thioredoxin family protein [Thermoanaerobaculia bacterium]|nr:thioredoxin family protein [Thermoanaerobaculia bacterium]
MTQHTSPRSSLRRAFCTAAALACVVFPSSAIAQQVDSIFRGFEPTGELQLEMNGSTVDGAVIYRSHRAASYLILGDQLSSPVLLNIRSQRVERVSFLKVKKNDDGTVDILADAAFEPMGSFKLGGQEVRFDLEGQKAVLAPKPPLLGFQTAVALDKHNPAYGFKAEEYQAKTADVAKLNGYGKNTRIRIYFGSWCPVCGRIVPRVMKLQELVDNDNLDIEYYGLPSPMSDDPIAEEQKIRGVPTAVVYVDGVEVGRLNGSELTAPESSFANMLADK